MAGCLDNVQINWPEWMDLGEKRNAVASIAAGTLFFTGWWFIIDVASKYSSPNEFSHAYHVCGVLGTISLFMINAVSNGQVRGDAYTSGFMGPTGARFWLFIGFLLGFGAIISSVWILIGVYLFGDNSHLYPGFALFIQNVCIFLGSLCFKFGRKEDMWSA